MPRHRLQVECFVEIEDQAGADRLMGLLQEFFTALRPLEPRPHVNIEAVAEPEGLAVPQKKLIVPGQ